MAKTLQNGSFQDPVGAAVNAGTVEFVLSQDAAIIAGGQVAPTRVSAVLDASGDMPGGFTILANDELTPSGTFYLVTVFDSNGARVFGPERWVLSGASPIDLDTIVPTIIDPAFANPVLQDPATTQTITGFGLTATSTAPFTIDRETVGVWNSVRVVDGTKFAQTGVGIQAAIDDLPAVGGVVFLPEGTYTVSAQINLPITGSVRIIGAGQRVTFIQVTSFGSNQALFKSDDASGDISLFTPQIENLTVLGNSNKSDPIAFDFRHPKNAHLRNVHTRQLGNISVFWTGTNNSRLDECTFLSSGRPLLLTHELTSTARFSITSAATTVTANEAVFSAADVNRHFIIAGAGPEGEPLNTSISAFTNSTTVTVADTASTTVIDIRGSFTGITGSITAVDATLTIDSDETIFDSTDVGRLIFVLGASSGNRILVTTIASVTNGTTVELTDNASTTVSDVPVWLTPSVAFLTPEDEQVSPSRITNDLVLTDIQVETYNGIGYLFGPVGTNVSTTHIKSSGHPVSDTNFGQSGSNYVVCDVKWLSISGVTEFGYGNRLNDAHLLTVGVGPVVDWHDFEVNGTLPENFGLVRQESLNANTRIYIGPGFAQTRRPTDASVELPGVFFGAGVNTSSVRGIGSIHRRDIADGNLSVPMELPSGVASTISVTSLADDAATSVFVPTFAGAMIVWTTASEVSALVMFRTSNHTGGALMEDIGSTLGANVDVTTGDLTGTTGVDGKFTISAGTDGKLYFENRRGFSVVFSYFLLAQAGVA